MLTGLFNYMLWVGAILCFIVYGLQSDFTDKTNLWLAVVMIIVIMVTGTLNFY
jgi:sodium/potassium-transporting ATPase subunit alpha